MTRDFSSHEIFKNSIVLITGGTGSFGSTFANYLLATDCDEIRIFSRDEKKQSDMRIKLSDPRVKFYLGDVRDKDAVNRACRDVNYIFHAAALKQVPSCEFFPLEAVKTNILGTENVISAAYECGVETLICLSTDKAVYPVNAMGISKAMMEKLVIASARNSRHSGTKVCLTRYGNVMASRGSVIPVFAHQIWSGQPLTITDPSMTRFMMTLDEAVDLVLFGFEQGNHGDLLVQKAFSSRIDQIATAVKDLMGKPEHKTLLIGSRHGEKLHETLLSCEEKGIAEDLGGYFRVPSDNRSLDYSKYVVEGNKKITESLHQNAYDSGSTPQLSLAELKKKMLSTRFFENEPSNFWL